MAIVFYSFLVVFSVVGPFLVEKVMHHTPIFYGRVALLMGIIWFAGSLISRWLTRFCSITVLPKLCLFSIIASIVVLIYIFSAPLSVLNLIIPTLILVLMAALTFSFSFGASLSLFPKMGGSNSAATGALLSVGTGTISSIAVVLKTNSAIPLFIVFLGFFIVSTLLYFLVVRSQLSNRVIVDD